MLQLRSCACATHLQHALAPECRIETCSKAGESAGVALLGQKPIGGSVPCSWTAGNRNGASVIPALPVPLSVMGRDEARAKMDFVAATRRWSTFTIWSNTVAWNHRSLIHLQYLLPTLRQLYFSPPSHRNSRSHNKVPSLKVNEKRREIQSKFVPSCSISLTGQCCFLCLRCTPGTVKVCGLRCAVLHLRLTTFIVD